jgi:hypothetical protein
MHIRLRASVGSLRLFFKAEANRKSTNFYPHMIPHRQLFDVYVAPLLFTHYFHSEHRLAMM